MKSSLDEDLDRRVVLSAQIIHAGICDFLVSDENKIVSFAYQILMSPEQIPDPSLDSVPCHGVSNLFTHNNSHSGIIEFIGKIDECEKLSSETFAFFI